MSFIYLLACLWLHLCKVFYAFPGSNNCTYRYSLPFICLIQTKKTMMQSSETLVCRVPTPFFPFLISFPSCNLSLSALIKSLIYSNLFILNILVNLQIKSFPLVFMTHIYQLQKNPSENPVSIFC